jgi:hypothetical protein
MRNWVISESTWISLKNTYSISNILFEKKKMCCREKKRRQVPGA